MAYEHIPYPEKTTEWPKWRTYWQGVAEETLYGTAPAADSPVQGRVVATHTLWDGAAVMETLRIGYGPGFAYSFEAVLIRPNKEGQFAAITWNLFETPFAKPSPVEREIIERGYILVGFDKERLMEDKPGGAAPAREAYPGYTWGAIRVWGFGHSLLATYLATRPEVDSARLVATGHSRGGKAAMAAAIYDDRFAVCASINSGAGGAGSFRFLGDRYDLTQDTKTVESLQRVGLAFPHWWAEAYQAYCAEDAPAFPFDLDILKALIAPRGLITCEGLDDTWANPYGTWRTWMTAQPVFARLGAPTHNAVFYREGGHAFSAPDWLAVLAFCDFIFDGKQPEVPWNNAPYEG